MCVLSQSLAAPSRDRERATLFEFELSEQRNPVAVGRVRVCVESVCVVWCEAAVCMRVCVLVLKETRQQSIRLGSVLLKVMY